VGKHNSLKPRKARTAKRISYVTADIEAYDWINFLCIGMFDGQNNIFKWFDDINDFADYLFDHCDEYEIENVFFQFGGIYDFMFLFQELLFNRNYKIEGIIPRGSGILSFSITEEEPTKWTSSGKPMKIRFHDSSALLPFALATLTEKFGVTHVKQTIAYEDFEKMWDTEEGRKAILEYLEYDVRGHWEVLHKFFNWNLIREAGPAFTISSQAIKIWRLFLPCEIKSLPDSIDAFVRKAYMGGRTEVFRPIFLGSYDADLNEAQLTPEWLEYVRKQNQIGSLDYADINSLYPTTMREFDYPIDVKGNISSGKHYSPDELGIWKVKVRVRHDMYCPPLGVKVAINPKKPKVKKLVYPVGTFTGYWTNVEIEYARSIGVEILKVYKGVKFKNGGKIFKPFVDHLYNMRLEAQAKGDHVGDILTKLIMNSTYGRTGISKNDKEMIQLDDGGPWEQAFEITCKHGLRKASLVRVPSEMNNVFSNCAIAAFVTSYSRILMHKQFMICGEDSLYYTDTDSVFTSYKGLEYGNKLGMMKLEYRVGSSLFLLPKTYVNHDIYDQKEKTKIAMKGFDKKKVKKIFQFNDFLEFLKGDVNRLTMVQEPKFAKFKTGMANGNFLMMNYQERTEEEMIALRLIDERKEYNYLKTHGTFKKFVKDQYQFSQKSIKSMYDKRIVTEGGFNTHPIIINEDDGSIIATEDKLNDFYKNL